VMVAGICCHRLSSSVTLHPSTYRQRNSPASSTQWGPVVLRPIRATPCFSGIRNRALVQILVAYIYFRHISVSVLHDCILLDHYFIVKFVTVFTMQLISIIQYMLHPTICSAGELNSLSSN